MDKDRLQSRLTHIAVVVEELDMQLFKTRLVTSSTVSGALISSFLNFRWCFDKMILLPL